MNMELDDLDELEASLGSCLDDLFPDARKTKAPVIYIKDKDYEFNVDPEKIEKGEATKFCNKYFSASKIHAMVEEIINFAQAKEECIPQTWGVYSAL